MNIHDQTRPHTGQWRFMETLSLSAHQMHTTSGQNKGWVLTAPVGVPVVALDATIGLAADHHHSPLLIKWRASLCNGCKAVVEHVAQDQRLPRPVEDAILLASISHPWAAPEAFQSEVQHAVFTELCMWMLLEAQAGTYVLLHLR